MRYEIELTHSKPIPTAVVRSQVPANELVSFVPAACGEVWSFIRFAALPRPGRHLALYLDARGSVEVGAEVPEPFAGNGRVHCSQLPAGRVATAVHFGPYGRLSEAHAAIREWCARHGHRCSGVSWEIYGHWDESWNADSSKIRTDVFHLLDDPKGLTRSQPRTRDARRQVGLLFFLFHGPLLTGPLPAQDSFAFPWCCKEDRLWQEALAVTFPGIRTGVQGTPPGRSLHIWDIT